MDRRLRSGFGWLLSGNVVYSACQWSIVWVLARLGTQEQVGLYALGMAVSAPILLFSNCQLRLLIAGGVKHELPLGQYLSFRFVSLGAALLITSCIAAFHESSTGAAQAILLVGCAQALEYVSESYYGIIQRDDGLANVSRSLLLKGPFALGVLSLTIYLTGNLMAALVGLALARLAVIVFWDARIALRGRVAALKWHWPSVRRLLALALPLASISMLTSLTGNIPRYFLEAFRGSSALGVFAAIASLLSAGSLVVAALGQSIFVPAAQAYDAGDAARYRALAWRIILLGAALGVAAMGVAVMFGRELLNLIFGAEYAQYSGFLVLVTIAGAISFMASCLGYVMTAAKSIHPQIGLLIASGGAAAIASYWLIPGRGLYGAAEAMICGAVVQLAGSVAIVARAGRELRDRRPAVFGVAGGVAP